MADQLACGLGNAADLAHQLGQWVEPVEQCAAGSEQVDLMCRHQRAARQRVLANKLHRPAIAIRRVVPLEVHALHHHVAEAQVLGPARKNLHDRRLVRRHADEVHRGPIGRRIRRVGRERRSHGGLLHRDAFWQV